MSKNVQTIEIVGSSIVPVRLCVPCNGDIREVQANIDTANTQSLGLAAEISADASALDVANVQNISTETLGALCDKCMRFTASCIGEKKAHELLEGNENNYVVLIQLVRRLSEVIENASKENEAALQSVMSSMAATKDDKQGD